MVTDITDVVLCLIENYLRCSKTPFASLAVQVKPPPSSVTQRNKQPWHPDEDDEEFTANEDEGQPVLFIHLPLTP